MLMTAARRLRGEEAPMAVGRYQWASNGRGQMRAADGDRDRAVAFLTTAFTEGRLTKDEYDARVDAALNARTYSDLDMVVTDLPGARAMSPYPPVRGTNGLAVGSLACGLGQLIVGPLATIPAIVLGHMARHQIKRTKEDGAGMALAGLLMGWAVVALTVFIVLVAAVAFGVANTHGGFSHAFPHPPPPPPPGP
jgi:uncharacterized membrane protein